MSDKKKKEVLFKDLNVGDKGEGWADTLGVFNSVSWIAFVKKDERSARVIAVNDIPEDGDSFCMSDNDRVWIEE